MTSSDSSVAPSISAVAGPGSARRVSPIAVAVACAVGNAVGLTAALRAIFSLFLVPVSTSFHWGRAIYPATAGAAPLVVAVLSFPVGRLIDRRGARPVLVIGIVLFGLAEAALSFANGSVVQMVLLWALFGVFASTQAPTGYVKVISGWFSKNRGLALGLAMGVGGSLGAAFSPLVLGHIINTYGWRWGFIALGAGAIFIGGPVMAIWLRDPPRASASAFASGVAGGLSGKEARRKGAFWLIFGATGMHQLCLSGVAAHSVAMLGDHHIGQGQADLFLAVFGITMMASQFVAGLVMDRVDSPKIGIPFYLAGALSVFLLHRVVLAAGGGSGMPMLMLTSVLLGVGSGAELSLEAYYVTRYFGLRAAGELFGTIYMILALSAALGGILFGVGYEKTGSYDLVLTISEIVLLVGVALIALLPLYRFAAHPGSDLIEASAGEQPHTY